jgi:hypothetical protein
MYIKGYNLMNITKDLIDFWTLKQIVIFFNPYLVEINQMHQRAWAIKLQKQMFRYSQIRIEN